MLSDLKLKLNLNLSDLNPHVAHVRSVPFFYVQMSLGRRRPRDPKPSSSHLGAILGPSWGYLGPFSRQKNIDFPLFF